MKKTIILSYAGGFMIGWPIGTAIGGGKPAWALAGIWGRSGGCCYSPFNKFE